MERDFVNEEPNSFVGWDGLTLQVLKSTQGDLSKVLARCVDGRYDLEDAKEAPLAVPGADAGIFAVVWSVLKEVLDQPDVNISDLKEDIVTWYMLIRWWSSNLRFHTDNHEHSNDNSPNPLKGCGYMWVLHTSTGKFDLWEKDIKVIDKFVERAKNGWAKVVKLTWGHKEVAVAKVLKPNVNVLNMTNEGQQIFVYNRALLEQFFSAFWPEFINMIQALESLRGQKDQLVSRSMEIMDKHVSTTLSLLGAGDKPIIEVKYTFLV